MRDTLEAVSLVVVDVAEEGLFGAVEAAVVLLELCRHVGSVHDSIIGLL